MREPFWLIDSRKRQGEELCRLKKIMKISFATILTELPVSLPEKRNANETSPRCGGWCGTAFVPRCLSSPGSRGQVRGRRRQARGKGDPQGEDQAQGAPHGQPSLQQGRCLAPWRNPRGKACSLLF